MSKLEVREIGPISGETEVRLAEGATAIGFGGGGKILQVVSEEFRLQASISPSGGLVKTAVKVSITPSSVNSKVMLHLNSGAQGHDSGRALLTGFFRNDELIEGSGCYYSKEGWASHSGSWVDSPNTTSEVTYTLGVDAENGSCTWTGWDDVQRAIQIIAMEVGE